MSDAVTGASAVVNQPSEDREKTRRAVDLIDDHQLSALGSQELLGVGEPALVRRRFEVKVDCGFPALIRKLSREGRFPDLTRAEQDYC